MNYTFYFIIVLMALASSLKADSWSPPQPQTFISGDSNLIVRVEPGYTEADGNKARKAHCRFFRYSEEKKQYEFLREHELINVIMPCRVIIPNDGSYLATFDDYIGVGTSKNTIVIYDSEGLMLKRWALSDILPESEIKKLPRSTSSIHWCSDIVVGGSQSEICIFPPTRFFKLDKGKQYTGFRLDVKSLTIREDLTLSNLPHSNEANTRSESISMKNKIWQWLAIISTSVLIVLGTRWGFCRFWRSVDA